MIFFYDIYPQSKKILGDLGVTLHALTTWRDVLAVAKASGQFEPKMLAEVEKFMTTRPAGRRRMAGRRKPPSELGTADSFARTQDGGSSFRCSRVTARSSADRNREIS